MVWVKCRSSVDSYAPLTVWIDAERLAAYQISIAQIRDALARQNADVPGGNVTTGKEELTLRTMGRFTDPRQFEDLVIANINGAPVKLRAGRPR